MKTRKVFLMTTLMKSFKQEIVYMNQLKKTTGNEILSGAGPAVGISKGTFFCSS